VLKLLNVVNPHLMLMQLLLHLFDAFAAKFARVSFRGAEARFHLSERAAICLDSRSCQKLMISERR
jgi:hypothetical protein